MVWSYLFELRPQKQAPELRGGGLHGGVSVGGVEFLSGGDGGDGFLRQLAHELVDLVVPHHEGIFDASVAAAPSARLLHITGRVGG